MILEGTTSSGAVVPVQVTTDGKVVAEGRTGPEGPQGPEGPEGPQGPEGPAGSPGNLWSGTDPGPIYYTGGLVGIGTSSPSRELHISKSSGAVFRAQDLSGTNQYIEIYNNGGNTYYDSNNNGNGKHVFRGSGGTEYARFDSLGRLGIGTTSPTENFVVSNNGAAGLEINPSGTDSGPYFQAFNRSTSAYVPLTAWSSHFSIRTGTNPTERARIDDSGRLLVGTITAPAGTLAGDVVCQGAVVLQSPNGTWWAIEVEDNGTLSVSQTSVR